jgi:hypothetical protein
MISLPRIRLPAAPSNVAEDIAAGQAWRGPARAGNDPNFLENVAMRLNAELSIEGRGTAYGDFKARLCALARLLE